MAYSYRVEQAIRAAAVLHKEQIRKGQAPFPYVTHLFAVAMLVSDYTDDEDVIVTALLHDTIEDTDYTPKELQDDFGGIVRDMVLSITQEEYSSEQKLSWKESKKEYLKRLKKASQGALIVAAADKIHNMRCIVEEYYDNHSKFLADFGGSLDDRILMYQEISNVFNSKLRNGILAEFNHVFTEYKNFIKNVQKNKEF